MKLERDLEAARDIGCETHRDVQASHCPICLIEERDRLRKELDARKGDPVTRLHNICAGLGEVDEENERLRAELEAARLKALEEVEKVCTNHLTWLNYLNLGGVNAEKMRTISTVLDAIRALKQTPQAGKEKNVTREYFVVWKDGSYRRVQHSWEYENDPDWLVTIPIEEDAPQAGKEG